MLSCNVASVLMHGDDEAQCDQGHAQHRPFVSRPPLQPQDRGAGAGQSSSQTYGQGSGQAEGQSGVQNSGQRSDDGGYGSGGNNY